jgi:hypothetical protein
MSKSSLHLPTIALSAVIGIAGGSLSAFVTTDSMLNAQPKVKVVDILQITQAQIKALEDQFANSKQPVSRETLTLIGQKAAADMLNVIAKESKNSYVFSKQQLIASPEETEITEKVASRLGLTGVKNNSMTQRMDIINAQAGK